MSGKYVNTPQGRRWQNADGSYAFVKPGGGAQLGAEIIEFIAPGTNQRTSKIDQMTRDLQGKKIIPSMMTPGVTYGNTRNVPSMMTPGVTYGDASLTPQQKRDRERNRPRPTSELPNANDFFKKYDAEITAPPKQTPPVVEEVISAPTRDTPAPNGGGGSGTQTSPGGGMPALTAADAAAFYQSKGIGGFTSNQLPGTNTNPFGGTTIEAVPFGGQEQSVTGNTLGAYMANGQAYAALDPSQPGAAFNPQAATIEGGSQRINQTPGVTPGNGKGSSRLNAALNDTAGMQSYMSKFGSPEQDMRRAADMAFLNAEGPGSSQMGLRAKEAVLGQFHTGGQTYQLNDDRSEFIQKDGKALAMDGNAASSYRLGTSTAAQYKDSYKDAVKQVAATETPVTPKQAENPFVQNPAAVSTAFRTDVAAGTMAPGSAEVGGMMDVVRGIDGTPPLSSQQISDSFLNQREPLMRDPRKK